MSKARIQWADGMKAGGMLAVVLYHTGIQADVKSMAYLLCLPAFFFVAGCFADAGMNVGMYFRRRTLRLLVPYLVFGILAWLAWLLVGRRFGSDAGTQTAWWEPLRGILIGRSERLVQDAPLWFLPCLIVMEWLYYLIARLPSRWLWPAAVLLAVAGYCLGEVWGCHLPWGADTAMTLLPLYVAGYALRPWLQGLPSRMNPVWGVLLGGAVIACVFVAWYYNPGIKLSYGRYGHPVLFCLGEVSVVAFWYLFARGMGHVSCLSRALCWFGRNTLWVLCMHIPLFGAVKGLLLVCGVPLSFYATNEGSLLLWAGSLIICVPLVLFLNRYMPFLGGRLPGKDAQE